MDKYPLDSIDKMKLYIKAIKSTQGRKSAGEFWYDLLKSILITVKTIRSSSNYAVFSCINPFLWLRYMTFLWKNRVLFALKY